MTDSLIPPRRIEQRIVVIRGEDVLLDGDLAAPYEVETRGTGIASPPDFLFQLSAEEFAALRARRGTSNGGRGGRRYRPYVFTEQGVAMLSSVLRSERAVRVSIEIVRTFVRLRRMAASIGGLRRKIDALEERDEAQFKVVFDAIRVLMALPPAGAKDGIGFRPASGEDV